MGNEERARPKKNRKNPLSAALSVLSSLLLVALVLACIPLTLPRLFGCQVYSVISGSMEPAIPTGSLVFIMEGPPEEAETDDVVAFYGAVDSASIITHRVVENRVVEGEFVTKGDANALEDLNTVSYDRLIGVVRYHVPVLGALMAALSRPVGKLYAVCFAVCGVMFNMLAGRMRARR